MLLKGREYKPQSLFAVVNREAVQPYLGLTFLTNTTEPEIMEANEEAEKTQSSNSNYPPEENVIKNEDSDLINWHLSAFKRPFSKLIPIDDLMELFKKMESSRYALL